MSVSLNLLASSKNNILKNTYFNSSFQLYKQIHQGSDKLDGEKCLAEIGDEDYLETMYSKKKPTE